MTPKTTWIVVADGAHARVVAWRNGVLQPAQPFEFAASHAPNRKFISDRPGTFADRGPGAHSYTPKHERREYEKMAFTRDVAAVIDAAGEANRFDRLVLVAPPAALGRLRAMLNGKSRARIVAQLGKDMIHLSLPQLQRHLVAFSRLNDAPAAVLGAAGGPRRCRGVATTSHAYVDGARSGHGSSSSSAADGMTDTRTRSMRRPSMSTTSNDSPFH